MAVAHRGASSRAVVQQWRQHQPPLEMKLALEEALEEALALAQEQHGAAPTRKGCLTAPLRHAR